MDDRIPPFLTVEEASRLLRIGRTKAYLLTQEWRATGGRSGLPVVDLGDVLRVPGPAIERMLGIGLAATVTCDEPANKDRKVAPGRPTPMALVPTPTAPEPAPVEPAAHRAGPPPVSASQAKTRRVPHPRRRSPDQLPLFQPLNPTNPNSQSPSPPDPPAPVLS